MSPTLRKFLTSRKFWAFVAGMVTLLGASLEDGSFSVGEIQTLAATIIGYVGSVALEDGLSNFNAPKRDATIGAPKRNEVNWNSFKQSVNWESLTETEKDALMELYFNG